MSARLRSSDTFGEICVLFSPKNRSKSVTFTFHFNYFEMKGNTISLKPLNESGKKWIEKTLQLLQVQEYGKGTVRNYSQELTLLFKHYRSEERRVGKE